ncbi:MAG: hypothetical protein IPL42_02095 [Saprospiraceae bacterium]|nr:hypothetical protein [Saprospiraceae bacterium]
MNLFGTLGLGQWQGYHRMEFQSYQNNFYLDETNENRHDRKNLNYRIGTDYFLSPEHTIGFLYTGFFSDGTSWGQNRIDLDSENSPTLIDSILIANTNTDNPKKNQSFNLNYRFDTKKDRNLNIDLDYAFYNNTNTRQQDNDYFDASGQQQLSEFFILF